MLLKIEAVIRLYFGEIEACMILFFGLFAIYAFWLLCEARTGVKRLEASNENK